MAVLLREAIGDRLRHARTNQRRTLREVSRSARVSLGYLSEVERGRKEASSELLAAICEALELPLSVLMHHVASDMSVLDSVEHSVPEGAERTEVGAGERGHRGPRRMMRAAGWCRPWSETTCPTCGSSRSSATASTPRWVSVGRARSSPPSN